jgi:hypothetical protein
MRFLIAILVLVFPLDGHTHGGHPEGHFVPDFVNHDLDWNAGGKLVRETFDCAKCHTPRAEHDAEEYNRMGPLSGFHGPNITQDVETGIGTWSVEDIEMFLAKGITPPPIYDFVGGEMADVINKTSTLTPEQRHQMAVYLKSEAAAKNTQIRHGGNVDDGNSQGVH